MRVRSCRLPLMMPATWRPSLWRETSAWRLFCLWTRLRTDDPWPPTRSAGRFWLSWWPGLSQRVSSQILTMLGLRAGGMLRPGSFAPHRWPDGPAMTLLYLLWNGACSRAPPDQAGLQSWGAIVTKPGPAKATRCPQENPNVGDARQTARSALVRSVISSSQRDVRPAADQAPGPECPCEGPVR